jgi:hypothetical protein
VPRDPLPSRVQEPIEGAYILEYVRSGASPLGAVRSKAIALRRARLFETEGGAETKSNKIEE